LYHKGEKLMRRIVKFTTFIFGLISCIHADINDGLVAFYPFNGNSIDESGHGNDGTPFGGVEFNTEDRFGLESGAAYFVCYKLMMASI